MAKQQPKQQPPREPPRKWGQGMASAALRQGAKELGNAIVPAFPQASPMVDEPGTMFNTPITGVSQQTGFAQPISYVDQHHQEMVGNTEPNKEQSKGLTTPAQEQPDMEIDK